MSDVAQTYRIILDAEMTAQARESFNQTVKGLEDVGITVNRVNITQKDLTGGTEEGLEKVARSSLRMLQLWSVMEIQMMRTEVAQNVLVSVQDRYNRTVAEYGKNSYQAIQAARELERVQNYVERANIRAAVSTAAFTVQLALQSGLLDAATWKSAAHTLAVQASTAAQWLENAALSAKAVLQATLEPYAVPLMIAGGIAAGAAVGYVAGGGLNPKTAPQINTNTTINTGTSQNDIDQAIDQAASDTKAQYRRQKSP